MTSAAGRVGRAPAVVQVVVETVGCYVVLVFGLSLLRADGVAIGLPVEGSAATGWGSHATTWALASVLGALLAWRLRRASGALRLVPAALLGAICLSCAWFWDRNAQLAFDGVGGIAPAGPSWIFLLGVGLAPVFGGAVAVACLRWSSPPAGDDSVAASQG